MSKTSVKETTRLLLWGKAAGRCQYEGCNSQLYLDSLTKAEFNTAYIAHIIADSIGGPRGHETLSEELKSDINNLMLLCDAHHRLIDKLQVAEHPVERLVEMKKKHEERMMRITDISEEKESHVIIYGANIGKHDAIITKSQASNAIIHNHFPSKESPLNIGLKNSSFTDNKESYWLVEVENLEAKFNQKIKPLKEASEIQDYSVFGLAPQPLLIKLGSLLYDLNNVHVYSNQKEPKGWYWESGKGEEDYFTLIKPNKITSNIALVFALSADVNDDRITSILSEDCSIWKITIQNPNNDFMKYKNHLAQFRTICREVLNEIKTTHGEDTTINVFPAMLPSTAIEFGRVRNPKADLPLVIFDENKLVGGFYETIKINN